MSVVLGRTRDTLLLAAAMVLMTLTLGASSAWALPDFDGDGVAPPADCDNLDASVKPGAADKPDTSFVDSNCDGIDGDATKAVFVAVSGSNAASGTQANPVQTITKGIELANAASPKKDVYVAGGTYSEVVSLVTGVSIFGGYAPISGARNGSETTIVQGGPAMLADNDNNVVLQLLTLRGSQDASGNSYGLRAINNSKLFLDKVTAQGLPAANGGNGSTGGVGGFATGFGGSAGGGGGCGAGALGALGLLPTLGTGGVFTGGNGQTGSGGASGASTTTGIPDLTAWTRPLGTTGNGGGFGGGGQGGRGGTGATDDLGFFTVTLCGGVGGPGGTGGGGGGGGTGGQAGGASFGALLSNSSLVASGSTLSGGAAGTGGTGGNGGTGGGGSNGSIGAIGGCFVTCAGTGFFGGNGGTGGRGGGGGGAPGGPSAGVYQSGNTSGYVPKSGTTETSAPAALGGFQGNSGPRAASGLTAGRQRTATAPATNLTPDFDGDGVSDFSDACPGEAAPGSGDGCVSRPGKLADNDGDSVPNGNDGCPDVARGSNDTNEDGCPDAVDNDGDGFPSTVDCNDSNAGINPSKAEIAENGVDENCDGADGVNLDRDGDGFNRPADCNDNNPKIKPGVRDIPANRIDENCDGSDAKAPVVPATVSFNFPAPGASTKFTAFFVKSVPAGSKIVATCKGKACGKKKISQTVKKAKGTVRLKKFQRAFKAGSVIEVRVTKSGFQGVVKQVKINKRKNPTILTKCLSGSKVVKCA